MRKLRRIFASALAALCIAACMPPALAAGYTDVSADAWYGEYLADLSSGGVVAGYPDGTFRPGSGLKLGEALRLALSAAGYGEQKPTDAHWASGYKALAVKMDMVAETAGLETGVTRLQAARLVAMALGFIPDVSASPFTDTDNGYVTALHKAGVVSGEETADGTYVFRPQSAVTRAELCSVLWHVKNSDIYRGKLRYGSYWVDVLEDVPVSAWSPERIVKKGIDVSYYQKEIDWAAVAADGVDFAMLRLGYRGYGSGALTLDTRFLENVRGAAAAGIDVGVYFFSQAITAGEAAEEAAFVLSYLEGHSITYPVCFDWEPIFNDSARTDGLSRRTLTECAVTFCRAIEAAGYTPSVYFTSWLGYTQYDLSALKDYQFWFAKYSERPDFYYDFAMWQYTSSGHVAGIDGRVDMNYSVRDYAA